MKTLRLSVAATVIALSAGQVLAADAVRPVAVPKPVAPAIALPASGYAAVYGGWGSSRAIFIGAPNDDTFGVFGGNGVVNLWHSPSSSIQLDFNAEATTKHRNCCGLGNADNTTKYLAAGGHWSWRSPSHLFGLFGGISNTNEISWIGLSNTQGLVGVEGQVYNGNVTWYGQAGYLAAFRGNSEYSANLAFARLVGRLFLTPTMRLSGEVGYAAGNYSSFGDSDPANFLNWGVAFESQLHSSPLSVFVNYTGFHGGGDPQFPVTQNQVVGGLRFSFGSGTLLDQDRKGATLDLPNTLLAAQTWDAWLN